MSNPPLARDATARLLVQPRVPESWPSHGIGACETILRQLPALTDQPSGVWIGVTGGSRPQSMWARLLARRQAARVHLSVRCMALSLAGFSDVCSADDVAFGRVP